MSIDRLIQGLPQRSSEERRLMRQRAASQASAGVGAEAIAAEKLVEAIDHLERSQAEALVEHIRSLPKARRVVEAFSSPAMTATERTVVQVLLDHPGFTSTELTAALGWKAQAWHMHFGTMCFNRRSRLWPAPPSVTHDAAFYSGILADFDSSRSTFTMMAEATEGFAALGLRPETG